VEVFALRDKFHLRRNHAGTSLLDLRHGLAQPPASAEDLRPPNLAQCCSSGSEPSKPSGGNLLTKNQCLRNEANRERKIGPQKDRAHRIPAASIVNSPNEGPAPRKVELRLVLSAYRGRRRAKRRGN